MNTRRTFRLLRGGSVVILAVLSGCATSVEITGEVAPAPAVSQADAPDVSAAQPSPTPLVESQATVAPESSSLGESATPAPIVALPTGEEYRTWSLRLCTRGVEFDEVLNVRDGYGTDKEVVGRVPGGSCALTTRADADLDEDWIPVAYQTAHVRVSGFVSTDFVEARRDRHEIVALSWVQAVIDGQDASPFEYTPFAEEADVTILEQLRGQRAVAVPYIDSRNVFCSLEGDVTVECSVSVRGADVSVSADVVVFVQQLGMNGYGDEFFPEDFGELPLVVGMSQAGVGTCPDGPSCIGVDWATISVDTRANVQGVLPGAAAEPAVARLSKFYGPPTQDTDWIVGCPLDGDQLNERYVEWGALTLGLVRFSDDPDGTVGYWSYDFKDQGSQDSTSLEAWFPPGPELVRLPGGLTGGVSLTELSQATRLPIETHELIGEPVIFGPGWTILGDQIGDEVAIIQASVPYLPICD